MYAAFRPTGPTVLVGMSPVQALPTGSEVCTSYRVRSLVSTNQYLAWAPSSTENFPAIAPTVQTPSNNTVGIGGLTTEVFILPAQAWFKADAAGCFEITPGEGL